MQLATYILKLDEYMLPCFSKKILGVDCPGCGIQRSVALILHGEFGAAFKMYPAIYTLLLLFGFLLYSSFYTVKYSNKITITLTTITVFLILINYILKFT
ncbi:DUF2752 domain-containing protein [Cellulophaga baltica]|uniref:Uncharacterized protein n=2 Tax=Flavobacteriaceae TaxID=49546 RepID=A0A1G7IKK7_9FLAO|nr:MULTISPECIES: DUF2752 domain-containing protein [Cellulophaga]AIY13561.1 hypothetical protein M667_10285 [Cellulophaga baltica NN016038]KGK30743.1 hypothetical protein EL45_08855 [Cellulophaga sp. E6(2014)]MBA6315114.1 DUF2752 domain-containing protein [Cellulophaga baltica]MCR1026876.1 DUF2752 domain-containing protein [Cellulophaga baltica]SDF12829.1 Protein of unknown function [Cellulophaga baltica]